MGRQAAYTDKRITTNLAHTVEPIVRHRILDSIFYKRYLYLTNELTVLPIVVQHVHFVAGTDSVGRPSPFLCCLLRLLELEPSAEIVQICLEQPHFKYLTALMLAYVRFAANMSESRRCFEVMEPFYRDYRRLRFRQPPQVVDGRTVRFRVGFVDEWVHQLLTQERVLGLRMPRLKSRWALEDEGLPPRVYGDRGDTERSDADDDSEQVAAGVRNTPQAGCDSDSYESDSE